MRAFAPLLLVGLVLFSGVPHAAATSLNAVPATVSNTELLALLEVRPETTSPSYERSFFRHWVDGDNDCQDTRVEVLAREDRSGARHSCRIVSGSWSSWLDGRTFTSARLLDVDHLVALKEAWGSGAHAWTSSERDAFANDLGYEWSLRAVSASSNRSKSDRDPAEWLPMPSVRCEYVSRWMVVKYRWGLAIDMRERAAILAVLDTGCGARVAALPPRVPVTGGSPTPPASSVPSSGPAPVASPQTTQTTHVVSPPDASSVPTAERPVHPGAFCAPAGATGMSAKGVSYVCRSSETDPRNRWRRG